VSEVEWFASNQAMWDERVPIHVGGTFYDVDDFRAKPDRIRPFEAEEVGDVRGKSLMHLQCHFGLDTLSWATRGATVVGLDFSEPAIAAARGLAAELDLPAEFVAANVYDAVEALGGRTFDIVYTGLGALNWLPDLDRWATVATSLVAPGGFLYVSEFHPVTWCFEWRQLVMELDYFSSEPYVDDTPGTYADSDAPTEHTLNYEWQHTLGDIVSTVIAHGLTLEVLHEHGFTLFPRWPFLVKSALDEYRFPEGQPRLPLMYSLRARKPPGD
jgi:SAM-dependent methyltransferase